MLAAYLLIIASVFGGVDELAENVQPPPFRCLNALPDWLSDLPENRLAPDSPGSPPAPQVATVSLNLPLLAAWIEDCRKIAGCKNMLKDLLPSGMSEIPAPWPNREEPGYREDPADVNLAEETADLLRFIDSLWSRVDRRVPSTTSVQVIAEIPRSVRVIGDPRKVAAYAAALKVRFGATLPPIILQQISAAENQRRQHLGDDAGTDTTFSLIRFEFDRGLTASSSPCSQPPAADDPLLPGQTHLERVDTCKVWTGGIYGDASTRIAVLDSGFDLQQRDPPTIAEARRFCQAQYSTDCDSADTSDQTGHGTSVTGVINARTDNAQRVSGVAWFAELLNLKMLGAVKGGRAVGWMTDGADALRYAASRRAAIATLAWGGQTPSLDLWSALLEARAADILVVAAAGNDQFDLDEADVFYPASFKKDCEHGCPCLDHMLVVGATGLKNGVGPEERKASFSNHGIKVVQIGAPGVGISTTGLERRGGIVEASGTSVATAIVTGAAALVADKVRGEPPSERARFEILGNRLLDYADEVDELESYFEGKRRLNVCRAVFQKAEDEACPD